jgi:hypothetical protein
LRIETVINNPYDFKVGFKKDGQVHYKKMKKSVTNLYKYEDNFLKTYLSAIFP